MRVEVRTQRLFLAFDPALVAVGLLDVLALVGNAHVRSRSDLYDEHGRDAGVWRVLAALTRDTGTLRLQGLLLDHRTHMEPGEQVRSVEPWTVLTQPLNPEGVLLAGVWQARTGRGNGYRGVTVAVVEGDVGCAAEMRLGIASVRVDRTGRGGVTVAAEVTAERSD